MQRLHWSWSPSSCPDLCKVKPCQATLLGSPIRGLESIDITLSEKLSSLKVLGTRLVHLHKQDALLLLRNAFAIPKILYVLQTAPCFYSTILETFDPELRSILSTVLNVSLDNNSTWAQATLPIASGGIGIRSSIQLAPSAFLASAAGSSTLVYQTLPDRLAKVPYQAKEDALNEWTRVTDCDPPTSPDDKKQKAWDTPCIQTTLNTLLRTSIDDTTRARLLAATTKEAGAWLNALPITSVGLRMEDDVIRIAAGLGLGAPLCHPHSCRLCGRAVDSFATHGLSCAKSTKRHFRHTAINNIIQRSLSSAKIPSSLEPSSLWVYSTHFINGSIPKIQVQDQTTKSVTGDVSFLITVRGLGFEVGMETHFLLCEVKDVMSWCTPVSSVDQVKP